MKLINETKYSTREVRKLLTEVHRRLSRTEGKLHSWEWMRVTVVYTRRHATSGWAYLSGSGMRLRVSRGGVSWVEFARLIDHEMLHAYGHDHKAYCAGNGYWSEEHRQRFAWAVEFMGGERAVERVKTKAKPTKADRRSAALAKAEAKLALWTRKRKLADTKVKTYTRKVNTLRKRIESDSPDLVGPELTPSMVSGMVS